MKKISQKLSMDTILRIKDKLEKEIVSDSKRIEKIIKNSIKGNNTSNVNVKDLQALKARKENQLIDLKLVIQKGNLAKHKEGILSGKSNFYYIYKLSVLVANKKHLLELDQMFLGLTKEVKTEITHTEVLTMLKTIESEIQSIEIKLSNFNHSHKEKVELDPDLNLI
jgi:hypothetical protein